MVQVFGTTLAEDISDIRTTPNLKKKNCFGKVKDRQPRILNVIKCYRCSLESACECPNSSAKASLSCRGLRNLQPTKLKADSQSEGSHHTYGSDPALRAGGPKVAAARITSALLLSSEAGSGVG